MDTQKDKKVDNEDVGVLNSNSTLLLWNDDQNSIDKIINNLIDICGHSSEQAEQCATIAHCNGKVDIKNGNFDILLDMKRKFDSKKINTTIES